ncbi:MAG TPA: 6-phosphogluconolactonase [Rhodanobacteraceae bacterium]|nr:6-phosphogluconolactonase [Rhodanobacteraceae bacterium]
MAAARNATDDAGVRWFPFATSAALREDAQRRVVEAARDAIAERDRFIIVLAGGNTPRALYEVLRDAQTDWSRWHIYFGDERCVASDDPDRNSVMATNAWLDHVPIPSSQRHPIPAELGAEAAARHYARELENIAEFDLVLLGLGEDGHVASLFPVEAEDRDDSAADVIAVFHAPKPPPERVSLTAARLSRTHAVLFLIEGLSKRDAVRRWRAGKDIPASGIRPPSGVDVLLSADLLA